MSGTPTNPTSPTAPAAPAAPDAAPEGLPPSGVEGLFPHVIAPDVDNSAPGPAAPAQTVSPEQFNSLQESFNSFREEAQQREARLTETIQTLMMRPAAVTPQNAEPTQQPTQQPTQFDLSDLPDPVQNPKAYNEALQARLTDYIGQTTQSQQQALLSQVSSAQALNGLWNRLQGQHPELAKRQILLQGAAAAEFSQLRAQGIDPVAVAAQNPDGLVANIVNRMQAELGIDTNAQGQPGPTTPTTPPAGVQPGASRAAGVAGGSQPSVPTQPTAPPKTSTFTDQLKQSQIRDGLI